MSSATTLVRKSLRFDVTIVSSIGSRQYVTTAPSSFEAWEKAADYCGDAACAITVMPASAQ